MECNLFPNTSSDAFRERGLVICESVEKERSGVIGVVFNSDSLVVLAFVRTFCASPSQGFVGGSKIRGLNVSKSLKYFSKT